MVKSNILKLLAMRCGGGQRIDSDINDALMLELTLAQDTTIEQNGRFRPWFLVSEQATALTVPLEPRLPIPPDFLSELEAGALYVKIPASGKYTELFRDDYDILFQEFGDSDPSIPKKYSAENGYLRFFPTPDIVYTVRQRYYERDQAFDLVPDTGENRWMRYAADLLMAVAGEQFALKHLQNAGLAQQFALDGQRAWDRVKRETEMRMHTNRSYQMGD